MIKGLEEKYLKKWGYSYDDVADNLSILKRLNRDFKWNPLTSRGRSDLNRYSNDLKSYQERSEELVEMIGKIKVFVMSYSDGISIT